MISVSVAGKKGKIMGKNNKQVPLYEQVLRDLRTKIVSGVYKKGDLLPSEKELIDSYGVSRITIRKALSILADMGLVETSQGKGSVVLFSIDNIQRDSEFAKAAEEHYREFMASTQIRLMLEPEIAKQVAEKATKEQIQQLKRTLKEGDMLEDKKRETFHRTMVSILDNRVLEDILEQLLKLEQGGFSLGVIFPENQRETAEIIEQQHEKIYEAIRDKNPEFAYFYMKVHTEYMTRIYKEYYERLKS